MVLFLSLFLIFLILDISVFKMSYITSKLDENLYYKILYTQINDKFDTELKELNIEIDVKKIIDIDMIKNDINNYLEGYYKKESYIIHSVEIETKSNKLIDDYLIKNNIEIENREIINQKIKSLISYYEKKVKASSILDKMPNSFIIFKNLCVPIMVISLISIFAIYLYMIFKMQSKPLGRVFMMTSLSIIMIQFIIQKFVSLKKLYTNDLIRISLDSIKNDVLYKFDIVCILLFVGGLIFLIFEKMFERK